MVRRTQKLVKSVCIREIISPNGFLPVISTPDAKNAITKIVILTKYMYNDLKLPNAVTYLIS